MTSASQPEGSRARHLRTVLGLNQHEFGWLFGVGERTIIRLEAGDGEGIEPSLVRLVRVLGEARLDDVESLLRLLLIDDARAAQLAARRDAFGTAMTRVRSLSGRGAVRLKDLRVWRWVYWATGARADAAETRRLAVDEGIICRQLRNPNREDRPTSATDYAYLEQLAPGDLVLLCHLQEPLGWFELVAEADAPTPVPSPVFRFVREASRLGQRLAKGNYRLHDGAPPGAGDGLFSCLSVRSRPDSVVLPAPRGRGIRDTMTPFVESSG